MIGLAIALIFVVASCKQEADSQPLRACLSYFYLQIKTPGIHCGFAADARCVCFLYQGGKIRAKDFPASALLFVLKRVVAALAGAHFHDVLHGVDENLAVADVAGVKSLFRRLDDSGDWHY